MNSIRGILFDLDGTLYVGDQLIPGAIETLNWCARNQLPVRFVTNTTSKPRSVIAEKLAGLGITVPVEHLFTAPAAAREYLLGRQLTRCHFMLREPLMADLAGIEAVDENPQAVIVGDMGDDFSYARLNQAFRLLQDPGCQFITLARNRYYQTAAGLNLDVGAMVAALEYGTGRPAELVGKPSQAFFEVALASMNCRAEDALMVGDDLESDALGAMAAGLRGLLVRTGKFREDKLKASPQAPDAVIDSIADLPAFL